MKDPMVDETWFWKPPIEGHRYVVVLTHQEVLLKIIQPLKLIDMDGRDENGLPIIEQVAEYVRKIR